MPATPRTLSVTEKDLAPRGSGSYSAIPVPSDQIAVLMDVEDYDKGPGKKGWVFKFSVMDCGFDVYANFSDASRWKIVQLVESFDPGRLVPDINQIDPNVYVGLSVVARIDWRDDPDTLAEGEPNFREIKFVTAMPTDEEEEAFDGLTLVGEIPAPF